MSLLTDVITAKGEERDQSLDALCRDLTLVELLDECQALDRFRRSSDNLYERVRALFFLYAIHRFHVPLRAEAHAPAHIPFAGYANLLKRRFEEAIELFLAAQCEHGPSAAISSALEMAALGPWPACAVRKMSMASSKRRLSRLLYPAKGIAAGAAAAGRSGMWKRWMA